jgi:hypothetical protein
MAFIICLACAAECSKAGACTTRQTASLSSHSLAAALARSNGLESSAAAAPPRLCFGRQGDDAACSFCVWPAICVAVTPSRTTTGCLHAAGIVKFD